MKRARTALVALAALAVTPDALAQFSYNPPGDLIPGSGSGRADSTVYVPGMRFPFESAPAFAVVDLRLADGSGLDVVAAIRDARADARIVMLTGYGNIATAVAAVKAGALDYLPKPADADAIEAALLADGRPLPSPPENPMSADRVRWEHIQRVFEQCDRNVSETARRLKMHRRTLQRILNKHAPKG